MKLVSQRRCGEYLPVIRTAGRIFCRGPSKRRPGLDRHSPRRGWSWRRIPAGRATKTHL